jgi:uncharacterized damage-inducible protein DinB
MKNFFRNKFQYNHLSNKRVIDLIISNSNAYSTKAQTLISHTLSAHHIWNSRINSVSPAHQVWDVYEISELQQLNDEELQRSLLIISDSDLTEIITYTNTQNQQFTNSIGDILFHIINHSTYHRGQLISELKAQGLTPISTDYIIYKRT